MTFFPNGKLRSRWRRLIWYELFKKLRSPELWHLNYYTGIILIKYVLICISIDSLVWFQNHLILYSRFKCTCMYFKNDLLQKHTTELSLSHQLSSLDLVLLRPWDYCVTLISTTHLKINYRLQIWISNGLKPLEQLFIYRKYV